ncbi:unnamed protein product, partial [Brenthis ino]
MRRLYRTPLSTPLSYSCTFPAIEVDVCAICRLTHRQRFFMRISHFARVCNGVWLLSGVILMCEQKC